MNRILPAAADAVSDALEEEIRTVSKLLRRAQTRGAIVSIAHYAERKRSLRAALRARLKEQTR